MHAVILTGRTLPGRDAEQVWAAAAALFKLEPAAFSARVLARAPVTVRETPDAQQAHTMRVRLQECGAEAELVPADNDKWFLIQSETLRGPIPFAYFEMEYKTNRLTTDTQIKQSGHDWTTLSQAISAHTAPGSIPAIPTHIAAAGVAPTLSELPPPLPRRAPPTTTAPHSAIPPHQPVQSLDSPDNWRMHWALLSTALICMMYVSYIIFKSPTAIWLIIGASSTWVYFDATRYRIGTNPIKRRINLAAGTWAINTFLLWIIFFPLYLAKRRALLNLAIQYPQSVQGRAPMIFSLLMTTILPVVSIYISKVEIQNNIDKQNSSRINSPINQSPPASMAPSAPATPVAQTAPVAPITQPYQKPETMSESELRKCRQYRAPFLMKISIYASVLGKKESTRQAIESFKLTDACLKFIAEYDPERDD